MHLMSYCGGDTAKDIFSVGNTLTVKFDSDTDGNVAAGFQLFTKSCECIEGLKTATLSVQLELFKAVRSI